jgi:alkylation response protein AidB-like acyl-CoA dehydrogenase
MNLDLSETQALLQETVRGYLEKELPFDRVRELEREQRYDDRLWKSLCEQGWLALPVGEPFGGAGAGLVDAGLLVEELARRTHRRSGRGHFSRPCSPATCDRSPPSPKRRGASTR